MRKVGYGEVEEVMSEFSIVNESINDKGRYRAARAAKNIHIGRGRPPLNY